MGFEDQINRRFAKATSNPAAGAARAASLNLAALVLFGSAFVVAPLPALADAAVDPHARHHHRVPETTRTLRDYKVPDVKLVRDDVKTVSLRDAIDDGRTSAVLRKAAR